MKKALYESVEFHFFAQLLYKGLIPHKGLCKKSKAKIFGNPGKLIPRVS